MRSWEEKGWLELWGETRVVCACIRFYLHLYLPPGGVFWGGYRNQRFRPKITPFHASACLWKLTPEPNPPRKNILESTPSYKRNLLQNSYFYVYRDLSLRSPLHFKALSSRDTMARQYISQYFIFSSRGGMTQIWIVHEEDWGERTKATLCGVARGLAYHRFAPSPKKELHTH